MSDVFLSYHSHDRPLAEQVFELLRASGLDVRFDCQSIPPGAVWMDEIETALGGCRTFVVLLTRTAPRRWVAAEVRAAIRRFYPRPDAFRIVPVRVDGGPEPTPEPHAPAAFLDDFQWLRRQVRRRGAGPTEPCAS